MKKHLLFLFLIIATFSNAQTETFHSFSQVTILGDTLNLASFAGKKVLVVNTASYCAYTPQYDDLEQLYTQYGGGTNFEIIGFPCNDFGHQEPSDDSTINVFCTGYNVTFQMMSKIDITSPDTAEVYKWLQLQSRNGVADAPVTWNFNKYLIDESGHWIAHYSEVTNPLDPVIVNWLTTTGINEIQTKASISVYPNPARESITIHFSPEVINAANARLSIIDALGNVVLAPNVSTLKSEPIDISSLTRGMYFIRLITGSGTYQTKILRQ
jgi:glutathione peroxidase